MVGVQVNREQGAQRNEEYLGGLVDAEPQDDQRDQRQVRHVADHLHRAVQQTLPPFAQAGNEAQRQTDAAADGETDPGAPAADCQMGPDFAAGDQVYAGFDDRAGRGQNACG